jgi:aminoglycoside phosphotransferase (APT) family kinase protein
MAMHAGELPVSADLVRKLVDEQFPRWRWLPVSRVSSPGTVNAIFRIGERLAARLPLRGTDAGAAARRDLIWCRASGYDYAVGPGGS